MVVVLQRYMRPLGYQGPRIHESETLDKSVDIVRTAGYAQLKKLGPCVLAILCLVNEVT